MTSKTKRILFSTLAAVAIIVTLDAVYLLGYRHGGCDALNWDFSAVVGGKVVRFGHGSTLLRSRVELRPARNVNSIPASLNPAKAGRGMTIARDTSDSRQSAGKEVYEPYFTRQNSIPDSVK